MHDVLDFARFNNQTSCVCSLTSAERAEVTLFRAACPPEFGPGAFQQLRNGGIAGPKLQTWMGIWTIGPNAAPNPMSSPKTTQQWPKSRNPNTPARQKQAPSPKPILGWPQATFNSSQTCTKLRRAAHAGPLSQIGTNQPTKASQPARQPNQQTIRPCLRVPRMG